MRNKQKFRLKVPNTHLLIFSLLVMVTILTWFIPGGEYEKVFINQREVVVQNSFKYVDSNPQGLFELFMAPLKGFSDRHGALIIGFVLLVGGSFNVLARTKAVDSFIIKLAEAHKKSKALRILFIPVLFTMFSLGGATFGMNEEIIPFVLIIIPICIALGYDSMVGVAIPLVGAHVGFASAFLNPFNVGIAQGIADVPVFSGIGYRFICWIILTSASVLFLLYYVRKISKNPKASPVYEEDVERKKHDHIDQVDNINNMNHFSFSHKLVLITFILSLVVLVIGVVEFKWFIEEIAAMFLIMGILVGIIGRLKLDEIVKAFIDGAKEMVSTAFIIALARAILIISRDGQIIDTILYALAPLIESSSPIFASQKMFIVQSLVNVFVPSGSGQAALTMPIMAPLSDIAGVSRQTAVLAFQFGDGFSNIIIPTSAVTMGVLTLAKIPWGKWVKWIFPLLIILFFLGFLLLIPPNIFGWN